MKASTFLGVVLASTATAQTCLTPTSRFNPQMATGWTANLLINGLKAPRTMVFDQLGNMLVLEQGTGVKQIKFAAPGCDYVCAVSSQTVLTDPTVSAILPLVLPRDNMAYERAQLTHGLTLSPDGNTLFVSSVDMVYAHAYNASAGTTSAGQILIKNMANGGHSTRTLLISKSNPDLLLVSRGSDGNIDPLAGNISTGHSTIKYFRISEIMNTPTDHARGGTLLGWGLRNSVGLGEHPITGGMVRDNRPWHVAKHITG